MEWGRIPPGQGHGAILGAGGVALPQGKESSIKRGLPAQNGEREHSLAIPQNPQASGYSPEWAALRRTEQSLDA